MKVITLNSNDSVLIRGFSFNVSEGRAKWSPPGFNSHGETKHQTAVKILGFIGEVTLSSSERSDSYFESQFGLEI